MPTTGRAPPGPSQASLPRVVASLWRLSRPATLPAPALGILCGAVAALGSSATPPDTGWAWDVALGAAGFLLLNAGSNALNQVCDLEGDRLDKPDRPLPSGMLTRGAVL